VLTLILIELELIAIKMKKKSYTEDTEKKIQRFIEKNFACLWQVGEREKSVSQNSQSFADLSFKLPDRAAKNSSLVPRPLSLLQNPKFTLTITVFFFPWKYSGVNLSR